MNGDCEVRENCNTYSQDKCWICEDYSLYSPIDKRILCKRQIRQREEKKLQKKQLKESSASKRGKRAKKKGYEGEREIVLLLEKYNIEAKRVPLSGALKGELAGDIKCTIKGKPRKIESKRRADGFKEDYKYLEQDGCDFVFKRADRKGWIVEMTFETWLDLVKGE